MDAELQAVGEGCGWTCALLSVVVEVVHPAYGQVALLLAPAAVVAPALLASGAVVIQTVAFSAQMKWVAPEVELVEAGHVLGQVAYLGWA